MNPAVHPPDLTYFAAGRDPEPLGHRRDKYRSCPGHHELVGSWSTMMRVGAELLHSLPASCRFSMRVGVKLSPPAYTLGIATSAF
ncbi:MAG TPA: hypothetical protein VMW80_12300 [Candidatus Dormibacteraeota bacterium]|nr:hypothetical protein [Candidatus Dormibacteraeota bacterium]